MRQILLVLFSVLVYSNAKATHIVGGDFYYEYLNGDRYRITMKLYLDCYNGNPNAIESDRYAIFGIFDGNNNLVDKFEIERTGPIHLSGAVYKCIVNPGDVCVDQYNYVFEVDLPKKKDGYIIAFQRCCRNNTIKNIFDAPGTGATYWVHVPDRDVVAKDNSPVFKKFPPIYVCKDFPLVFNHSATDKDGDSLSYELYQPYNGGDKDKSRPDPPSSPPFRNVVWTGGYSTGNQMRGNPILEIDETTGELTVTPNILGQFVIGVKVKEWRNGVLIGETLRDYQFNVVDCQAIAVANFQAQVKCSDTVKFTDKSIGASSVSWDFGDPSSGMSNNTSNLRNPTHVFSRDGDFVVTVKAWNPACQDEYSLKVKIRTKKTINLGKDKIFCVPFNQRLTVPFIDFTSMLWSTGSKASFITVSKPGTYWFEVKYASCLISDTVNIGYDPVSFTPLRDSLFCDKVDAFLEIKNRSPLSKILWAKGDTSAKIHAQTEGKYIVRVYNKNCSVSDTVTMTLAKITPNLGPDVFICNSFVYTFDAGTKPAGTSYLWNDGSSSQTLTTSTPGKYWVTTFLKHCSKSDTMVISNSRVKLDLGPDRHFCDSVRLDLDAGPPNAGGSATYVWSNGATTQVNRINNPGKHWVVKKDNFGCTASDSVYLNMSYSPIITLGKDTQVICLRAPIKITPGDYYNDYVWEDGSKVKVKTVELSGKYYVTVTDELGCKGSDTIIVKTDPNLLPNFVYIPNAFTPNGDGLNDVFPFESPVLQTDYNLKIFDRWGEKVYDSDTNRTPWDGTTRNADSQLDAYMWIATYKGCDGNRKTDKGTVTVLR